MYAALPMYDRPETAAAHDALWARVRDGLRARGIAAPDALDRAVPYDAGWERPDLVLGQVCNLPYRVRLRGRVVRVAAADYGLPGDPPGYYHSVLVARAGDPRPPAELALRLAFNDALSNSGWDAARRWAEGLGHALRPVLRTGAHALSARAVAAGEADLAAIDAVTWRGLLAWEPAAAALRVLGRSPSSPGMTFVARAGADPAPYLAALREALAATDPTPLLGLRGVVELPEAAYDLPIPQAPAYALG